jgi:hypothetical protein
VFLSPILRDTEAHFLLWDSAAVGTNTHSLGACLGDRDLESAKVVGRAASGSRALRSDVLGHTLRHSGGIARKGGESDGVPLHYAAWEAQVSHSSSLSKRADRSAAKARDDDLQYGLQRPFG